MKNWKIFFSFFGVFGEQRKARDYKLVMEKNEIITVV